MPIKTNPIQSQSNPIKANTNPISEKPKMKLSPYSTKDYENKLTHRTPGKQTQSNPILSAILSGDLSGEVNCRFMTCVFSAMPGYLWIDAFEPVAGEGRKIEQVNFFVVV